jgi:hypothetical protein
MNLRIRPASFSISSNARPIPVSPPLVYLLLIPELLSSPCGTGNFFSFLKP